MNHNHIKFPMNELNFNKRNLLIRLLSFKDVHAKLQYLDICLDNWKQLMKFNKSLTLVSLVEFAKALKWHLSTDGLYKLYSPRVNIPAEYNLANYEV